MSIFVRRSVKILLYAATIAAGTVLALVSMQDRNNLKKDALGDNLLPLTGTAHADAPPYSESSYFSESYYQGYYESGYGGGDAGDGTTGGGGATGGTSDAGGDNDGGGDGTGDGGDGG